MFRRGAGPVTAAPRAQAWHGIGAPRRLPREFVWRATFAADLAASASFRLRLTGSARLLTLAADGRTLELIAAAAAGTSQRLATVPWPRPPRSGDTLDVVRTWDAVSVFFNGTRLLYAGCAPEAYREGVWESTVPEPCLTDTALQKLSPPLFGDDFMHVAGDLGQWEIVRGTWTIHAEKNPIRSANPFSIVGSGTDALIAAGHWFWRNYELRASVLPLRQSAFGLVVCQAAGRTGYALEWRPAPADQEPMLQLKRTVDGAETVLAEVAQRFQADRWVRLSIRQIEGFFQVEVDGTVLLEAVDPAPLLGGRIGLWTAGRAGAVFDDVDLGPVTDTDLRFDHAAALRPAFLHAGAAPAERDASTAGLDLGRAGGRLDLGGLVRRNVSFRARVRGLSAASAWVELRARQHGDGRGIRFRVERTASGATAVMSEQRDGAPVLLAAAELGELPDTCVLAVHVRDREAWACVDERLVCVTDALTDTERGTCGVRAPAKPGTVRVDRLRLTALTALPVVPNRAASFGREKTMHSWSSPVMAWVAIPAVGGTIYQHRSDFWQDVRVTLQAGGLGPEAAAAECGLLLAGAGDPYRRPEVRLAVRRTGATRTVRLRLPDRELIREDWSGPAAVLAVERRCDRFLVCVDNSLVWNEPVPPAFGDLCRIGRFGPGDAEAWAAVLQVEAAGITTDSFELAPVDWVPVCGDWDITSRWSCDQRWSFFAGSGWNGLACLWSKRRHGRNVTLEFYAAAVDPNGGYRTWDINCVIAADGQNIDSGYSFLYGGWRNRGSQIVRGRRILTKNAAIRWPRSFLEIHERWFQVKVRKHEDLLTFWVDGQFVDSVRDPNPLTGNRFGLWTWRNAITFAQVRVSTDSELLTGPQETGARPRPRTPYDQNRR